MRRWAILNVLLGLIVMLLAVEIVRTWARALPPVEVQPREPVAAAPHPKRDKGKRGGEKGAQHADQRPEVMIATIAEKDLFDPSRHPPSEEAKPEPVKETGPPAGLTIVGVRIFGKDREVFVTDATQGGTQGNWQRRLRTGDQVAGYTIKSIEPTSVLLTSPSGDQVKMPLTIEKAKGAPAPPTPRPTPGRGAAAATAAAQPPTSPAAGAQGASPAAGVGGKPAAPPVPPPQPGSPPPVPPGAPAAQTPQPGQPQLPAEVRQKLEQLRHNDKTPRLGRKP
jgi:hypothetical protein